MQGRFNQTKFIQVYEKQDKSPDNEGLTKEFYETFWEELKKIFVDSVKEAKEKGRLITSQRQAFIKLIQKMVEIKDFLCKCKSKINVKSSFIEIEKRPTR